VLEAIAHSDGCESPIAMYVNGDRHKLDISSVVIERYTLAAYRSRRVRNDFKLSTV
jgi:hypothetical protein